MVVFPAVGPGCLSKLAGVWRFIPNSGKRPYSHFWLDFSIFDNGAHKISQRQYDRAMAAMSPSPATSTAVAEWLGLTDRQAAPIRDELIKNGMAYSPSRGTVAFTVPKFDAFMQRQANTGT